MHAIDLTGRVVVVTGARGRLGQRLLSPFAAAGATLAGVDRTLDDPPDVDAPLHRVAVDTTDEAAVVRGFAQIKDELGRVDVLVHTVGTWGAAPFLETSASDWEQLIRLNLTSAFLCFREALRAMDGGPGRLIAFASAQGADRGTNRQGAYSAAKAGIVRLVEAVAAEHKSQGVGVYAIAPSTILFGGEEDTQGVPAEHLADLCLSLCAPAALSMTGSVLRAYGA